ncbi:hypothetical protein BST81_08595 [Leptolyngbya sp. 'hensonii']|uniref:glycosyltransferase family 4 protein n=1 Tax=Leptolyngbya sp. 'hensonii' TaxID=1922337 RepID=UPI00094FBA02|nr:glycosyltransferase family 4 protein [Leptolyngbya sp. 'hensonii']OLP18788.1 hypothetical protein BST81_08595 [Leptolyngbya sp. 'hensonii']
MPDRLKVLSLSTYTMGHITHQNILEQTFREQIPEVELVALHLPNHFKQDLAGRILYRLMTPRVPLLERSDADFYRLRNQLALSLYARRCLDRALAVYSPDVLHIHTQSIALLAESIMSRIPTVVSLDYTTALLATEHPAPAGVTYRPIVGLERRCFQVAAHVVACSDRARQSVLRDYGLAPDRVSTIHWSLPLERFNWPLRTAPIGPKPRLLFVGNDFVRKGGEDVLAVWLAHLAERSELDIVSNSPIPLPDRPDLRHHQGIGPLSPELLQLYQQADIFVMPTYEEVYGMVFIEATAAGLPCVGTTVMAVPELVQSGRNGFTIAPGDRQTLTQVLRQLIDQPELRHTMGLAGRAIAQEKFNAIHNFRRLADLFAQIRQERQIHG